MCGPHPLQPETFLNEFDTISGSSLKTVGATAPVCPRADATVAIIYRPGSEKPTSMFSRRLVAHSCPVIVGGDFNLRARDENNPDARRLANLLSSSNMVQHVDATTHRCGNTLGLVVTFADCPPDSITVQSAGWRHLRPRARHLSTARRCRFAAAD